MLETGQKWKTTKGQKSGPKSDLLSPSLLWDHLLRDPAVIVILGRMCPGIGRFGEISTFIETIFPPFLGFHVGKGMQGVWMTGSLILVQNAITVGRRHIFCTHLVQGGVRHCLGGPRATLLKIDEEFQSHSSTKEQRPHTLVFVRFKQMGNPAYRSAPHSTETKEGKKRPGMYCVLFQS